MTTLNALVFRRPEVTWCSAQLKESSVGGAFRETGSYPLARYALWLAESLKEHEAVPYDENDVYGSVAAASNDESSLTRAIRAMCEYHVQRVDDPDDTELWLEFELQPYDVYPAEYVALVVVRLGVKSRGELTRGTVALIAAPKSTLAGRLHLSSSVGCRGCNRVFLARRTRDTAVINAACRAVFGWLLRRPDVVRIAIAPGSSMFPTLLRRTRKHASWNCSHDLR